MSGPLAVVTGSGSGIGAAIALELAGRGYTVVPTDLDLAAAQATAQRCGASAAHRLDVTDPDSIAAALNAIVAAHGAPEVWVSNAGVSRMRPFLAISPAELDHTIEVNLKGVFHAGQAAARAMVAAGRPGVIVNVASMAGKQGRVPYLADYVASKFAVVGLTQAMAFELAEHQIRVNSVCPGYVATPMQERELAWEAELRATTVDAIRALYLADTPLRRLETPEDVARVVGFLVGPDATFVTGEAIAVNGGAFMD